MSGDVAEILDGVAALVLETMPAVQDGRYAVEWKPDGSPVTRSDVLVERTIGAYLEARLGAVNLVGEESFTGQGDDAPGWTAVLDPIDGTENFCSGLKEWGVSLSLWFAGEHRGSLLALPELGVSLKTGDDVVPIRSRITGFSSSITPALAAELVEAGEGRIVGCAVYNLWCVITGRFRRFVNPVGAFSWDLQAGVMLAREHGCEVILDGEPYGGHYLAPGRRYRVEILNGHAGDSRQGSVR